MAWRERRTQLFIISLFLGIIGAAYGVNQAIQDREQHKQNQFVLLHDLNIIVDNQKILVANQKDMLVNRSEAEIRDINTQLYSNYSQLPVNPITGQR
ncbi:MAG TPA: hypothetical protein VGE97_01955 [Nitrososphaera sp.]